MRQRYDALVIGTGFGGSVAACRLAQAGLSVGILERGRRYGLGEFPRDWSDPAKGWLWQHEQGLYDVRPVNEMTIVQGAAYGGGSHLYANVHLRMPADGFATGWPAGYRRTTLDPYYDLVAYMLDLTAIGEDQPLGVPMKTLRMEKVAADLGRSEQFCRPTLAVNFADPDRLRPNRFGVRQYGCRHCGECDIGCNYQAKNTLDLSYLAVAEQHGAEVGTRCEVTRIDPIADGYRVTFTDHEAGGERTVEARTVVLGAGAVNTTELLLRCRDQFHSLPGLSPMLGHGYSGNGDFLAFAVDTGQPWDPWAGPTITTGIVYDHGVGTDRRWFIFEEGGFPRQIAKLMSLLSERDDRFGDRVGVRADGMAAVRAAARDRIPARPEADSDAGANIAVFLAMGRDSADGRIELLPVTHELRVTWNLRENLGLYQTEQRLCADVAHALGGRLVDNPLWDALRLPVSVHNLGGCVLGEDERHGVVDPTGQVFGCPGLYVMDGACLPRATGVNPAHTIAAVAERNIETAIREITGQPRWVAPEREKSTPVTDPLAAVRIPRGGTAPPRTPGVGLSYAEVMHGTLTRGVADPERETAPAGNGASACAAEFRLTVTTQSVPDFASDPNHRLAAAGFITIGGFTDPAGARIGGGVIDFLVAGDTPDCRRVRYTLPFNGPDGIPYLLDAHKDIADHGRFDVWGSSTTLYARVRRGHRPDGPVLAAGRLRQGATDLVRELATVRVTGTSNPVRQAEALADVGGLFADSLWRVFLRPHLPFLRSPGVSDDRTAAVD